MPKKIGLITIGQAPRKDLSNEIDRLLEGLEVHQYGALDGLTIEEITPYLAGESGAHTLTTALQDQKVVALDKKKIIPLLQKCLERAQEDGISICVMLCTSLFSELSFRGMLLQPGRLVEFFLSQYTKNAKIGILVPTTTHVQQSKDKFSKMGWNVRVAVASPYIGSKCDNLDGLLPWEELDCVIFDCASFRTEFSKQLRQYYNGTLISPLEMALRISMGLAQ